MGVRENKVERYLRDQVRSELCGDTRAWKKSNRDGIPDQIVFISNHFLQIIFVEVKTEDGELDPVQIREANNLRNLGAEVTCVYGHSGVDALIVDLLAMPFKTGTLKREYR